MASSSIARANVRPPAPPANTRSISPNLGGVSENDSTTTKTRRYLSDLLSNPPAPRAYHSVVVPTIQPVHTLGIVFKLAKWKYLSRPLTVGHNPCVLKWTMGVGDHISVATAFAFGTRFLFTASHVLDPPEGWAGDSVPEMVYLAARDNSLVVAAVVKVLYRDRDLDVAILECGTAEFSPLSLRYAEGIKNYEPVYTVDVIDHSYAIVHKGSCYPGSTKMELLMDARTFQGFNGGPILDESGEVVGMCLGTWGASGRAVTSDGLRHVYNAARALGIDCNLWSDKSWGFQQDNIRAIPTNGHGASGASGGSPPGRGRQSAFASVHRAVYMERAPSIEEFMTKRWLPAGTVPSRYATILDGLEPAPLAPRAGDVHGPPYSHSQPINREMAPRGWRSSDPRSSSGSNGGGPSRENDSSTMIGDGTDPGAGLAGWNTSSQDSQASQASQSSAAATAGGTSVTDESVGYEGDESMGDEPDGGEPMEDVSEGDESG